jgi:hypothetical protein
MNGEGGSQRKTIVAIVLAVIAVPLFVYTVWSARGTQAPAPEPRAARLVRQVRRPAAGEARLLQPSLDPTLQLGLLKESESVEYKGTGRNIFAQQQEVAQAGPGGIPTPLDCAFKDKKNPACAPPPPPGPPPIPLKFYGFASERGQTRKVFLSEGENIFIAGEGDIVNRRYRVVQIGPTSVTVQDMLSNNQQTIRLSG